MNLLPPASTELERALADVIAQVASLPVRVGDLWNPDACPVEQLPWLAWARSTDTWSAAWTEEQRRQAIRVSYEVHRHKGTPAAVKAALTVVGTDSRLVEWFDDLPPGPPYTFAVEVNVDGGVVDDARFDEISQIVNAVKNTRSHLTSTRLVAFSKSAVFVAAALICAEVVTVGLHADTPP